MVNYYTPRIEELEVNVTPLGPKITTLQEFGLGFYDDLQNLHSEINAVERDVGALSDSLALSYIQQSEKANFAVTHLNVSGALTVKGAPFSYNDLKDLPVIVLHGYLPPISLTTNPQEVCGQLTGNVVYLYESSITPPSSGLFSLTSFVCMIR